MRRLIVLAVATVMAILTMGSTPAHAATRRIVWVDSRVNAAWPVPAAVSFVDRFTGTLLRFGPCHKAAACIVIREDWGLPRQWGAVTWPGYPTSTIKLNPRQRSASRTVRLHIVAHELGHAHGVYAHTGTCISVMFRNVYCPSGRLAPLAFTAAERRTLLVH